MGGFTFRRLIEQFLSKANLSRFAMKASPQFKTVPANFAVADARDANAALIFWRFGMAKIHGRPRTLTFEFCQDIWVRFEFLRVRLAKPDGRLASIRHVATALAAYGGVAEIVGGNKEMLALELASLEDEISSCDGRNDRSKNPNSGVCDLCDSRGDEDPQPLLRSEKVDCRSRNSVRVDEYGA